MNRLLWTTVLSLSLASASQASTVDELTGFVTLGDSLSDDGKLDGFIAPPSFEGRFTNGRVWAEIFGDTFTEAGKNTLNLALAGATAGDQDSDVPDALQSLTTLGGQVATLAGSGLVDSFGDNPLVSVLIGANDLFDGLADIFFDPFDVARNVGDGIRAVAGLGDQYDDFLVINVPDLTLTPAFGEAARLEAEATGNILDILLQRVTAERAQSLSLAYQIALEEEVEDLIAEGLAVTLVDQTEVFFDLLDETDPTRVETVLPCTRFMIEPDLEDNCAVVGVDQNGLPIIDISVADGFIWADAVHPSQALHQALAEDLTELYADVLPAPIPLPAALPPMLFIFVWLAVRRKTNPWRRIALQTATSGTTKARAL
ncbi:MAG: SGNH/GDSL hydrolase family protein [Pseudomonadota bacterium]